MELFKLFGSIFIDTDAAEKSMQKVEQAAEDFMTKFGSGMEKVGERIEKFGDKMSSTGTKMTLGVTTPLVALGTKAISTAADFEAAMSEVGAISGATGEFTQETILPRCGTRRRKWERPRSSLPANPRRR